MSTTTTVIWNPIPAELSVFKDKADAMKAEGKTTGAIIVTWPGGTQGVAPMEVVREWTTTPDAQEWINFVNTYNPQSAIING
jgi:hypothetical protein